MTKKYSSGLFKGKWNSVDEIDVELTEYPANHNISPKVCTTILGHEVELVNLLKKYFKDKKLQVIDIGASAALQPFYWLENFVATDLKSYSVIDLPRVLEVIKSHYRNDDRVKTYQDLTDVEWYDYDGLVYCNAAFEYMEKPLETLKKILKFKPTMIAFRRFPVTDECESFVSVQHFQGSRMFYWFMNRDEVIKMFEENGYELKFTQTNCYYRIEDASDIDLVFVRKNV